MLSYIQKEFFNMVNVGSMVHCMELMQDDEDNVFWNASEVVRLVWLENEGVHQYDMRQNMR